MTPIQKNLRLLFIAQSVPIPLLSLNGRWAKFNHSALTRMELHIILCDRVKCYSQYAAVDGELLIVADQ